MPALAAAPTAGTRTVLVGTFESARPGRFARAAIAGMTAAAERLWSTNPDFVACVRDGELLTVGTDTRFLVGVTAAEGSGYVGGGPVPLTGSL